MAEFRGLGVHVTRTTRTTRRTKARAKVLLKLEFDTEDQVLLQIFLGALMEKKIK